MMRDTRQRQPVIPTIPERLQNPLANSRILRGVTGLHYKRQVHLVALGALSEQRAHGPGATWSDFSASTAAT